ncbi:MAG: DMT family transporter [Pseudomonadota bacterium]
MATASAFIAATMVLAKALGTDTLGPALPPLMVTFGRFVFAWLTVATALAILRPKFARPNFKTHLMRSACGFTGVTLMFAAAAQIPLSDATAISFLNPIFTMVLAIPLLGERVGKWRWIAAAVALCGALVLTRPGGGALEVGAVLALGAALAYGFEVIFIKRLAGGERPLQLLFVNNSIGLTLALCLAPLVWQSPTPAQWGAMAALGCLMACAQFCFVNSMARGEASFVAPFVYLTLVFAALYDAAIFGVLPDGVSVAGAVLILLGAALLAWREHVHRLRRPEG